MKFYSKYNILKEKALDNVVCKMSVFPLRPLCVNAVPGPFFLLTQIILTNIGIMTWMIDYIHMDE